MIIKHGAIVPGQTPSEVSGKCSEVIKNGSAVLKEECPINEDARLLEAFKDAPVKDK